MSHEVPYFTAERIRVRGLVQGVGFRPTVWRLAQELGLVGSVLNDGDGVLIEAALGAAAAPDAIERLCMRLTAECPPLARIDRIERRSNPTPRASDRFEILASTATQAHTGIVADAATCAACAAEIQDPANRRFRYPFTNCTHCGPRLSIVRGIPYDRASTSMAVFPMCPACEAEYRNPADRRFHAQPNACPVCGPRVWLADAEGRPLPLIAGEDPVASASRLLAAGRIIAIKGIGGFHLACDASNPEAVAKLRRRKRRFAKPFALMVRDLAVASRYCRISEPEAALLASPAAPILLLDRLTDAAPSQGTIPPLTPDLAPGQSTLGIMLPYSPLHQLLLADWDRPLVMTSGNLSEEPQCIENGDAAARLGQLADAALLHDRDILNRVDDSVLRVMAGAPRLLRRARGYAPTPLSLPPGLENSPPLVALGGELKNTFCLIKDGQAILSQHLGDLEEARTAREYQETLRLYLALFQHRPELLVCDLHPDYRSTLLGQDWANREALPLLQVQHHHAHLAAVLADAHWPADAGPVIGILLDGLGYGDDGTVWGGEILLGDYLGYRRLGHLKPVAMPGGAKAIIEPWRNLLAQLLASGQWQEWQQQYGQLAPFRTLADRPVATLETMIARGIGSPLSSSAGRLFDAVATALGVGGERVSYEGQAAIELEALAALADPDHDGGGLREGAYRLARQDRQSGLVLDPAPLWPAIFADLAAGEPPASVAARFHQGLAQSLASVATDLARQHQIQTLALSGGVFQNRLLLEAVSDALQNAGLRVLIHQQVPANDGGLALGQACIGAARSLAGETRGRGTGDARGP